MSSSERKQPDDELPQVTVEEAAVVEITPDAEHADITITSETDPRRRVVNATPGLPPIEATAEQPALTDRDISAMADPHNAASPMATDFPGRRDDNATPEHGSGAPIPWPFSH